MKKIITIIGARPQIIKASAISRAIKTKFNDKLTEIIVHTGQHYDENMSGVFFDELGIPKPNYNLSVGSRSHGKQTALMIDKIEEILLQEKPNALVLYGDTNSTLAGAITASKINIPIVHVEAGLRSFNKTMPEEINRIMCDHVSTLLFSPTAAGINNLKLEGFNQATKPPYTLDNPKIEHIGDVMFDNSLHFSKLSDKQSTILDQFDLTANDFILCTVHRNHNTDTPERLNAIFKALNSLSKTLNTSIVLPLHPRTKKLLSLNLAEETLAELEANNFIKIIEPVSFLDMLALEKNSKLIITDSGGVQKEAYFFHVPCVILRPETEWVELVENGNAIIADANKDKIMRAVLELIDKSPKLTYPTLFGNGKAAEHICREIIDL